MNIQQSGVFSRRVKRLHPDEKIALDKAIKGIIKSPDIGQMKKGDLAGVRVHKFKYKEQQYLIAYLIGDEGLTLTLLALGTHENFYRNLKRSVAKNDS